MPQLEMPAGLKLRLGEKKLDDLVLSALSAERQGLSPVATLKLAPNGLAREATPETVAAIGPWLEQWRAQAREGQVVLEATKKNFAIARNLTIPKALSFETVTALGRFFGGSHPERIARLRRFLADCVAHDLVAPHSVAAWRAIYSSTSEDLTCLLALMKWRSAQDATTLADTALREVPVAEIHTKWIETHRGLVLSVFRDLGWATEEGDLSERLGLAVRDRGEVWARLHGNQTGINGQRHLNGYAPSEFTEAPEGITRVLIVENRTTFDRLPMTPGTCVIFGSGKAILSYAPKMTWLSKVKDAHYWGDCDGAGYFILSRLRRALPQLRSIGMDLEVVTAYGGYATAERPSEAVTGPMPELTGPEAQARKYLHARGLRLEQEFIPYGSIAPSASVTGSQGSALTAA